MLSFSMHVFELKLSLFSQMSLLFPDKMNDEEETKIFVVTIGKRLHLETWSVKEMHLRL